MAVVSMKSLLEAGVHFGHQTRRWNPKMARYIFTERNGIYIIDLQKQLKKQKKLILSCVKPQPLVKQFCSLVLKKQAQDAIKEEATRANMFFVNERWLGGMLTNFKTIETRIKRLKELEKWLKMAHSKYFLKKKLLVFVMKWINSKKYLGGIKDMPKMPGAIVIVDPKKEKIAIQEAHKLGIPVVATVDTNCDPDEVDFPIPANDDAIRAVKLLISKLADAVIEGAQDTEAVEAE